MNKELVVKFGLLEEILDMYIILLAMLFLHKYIVKFGR